MSQNSSTSAQWVPVDFTSATIIGAGSNNAELVVTGETPSSSSTGNPVKLEPEQYIAQPEYWRIEVLWNRANSIFPTVSPFEARLLLRGVLGRKGIEVVGKTRNEKISC
jgi:hypothetical protein